LCKFGSLSPVRAAVEAPPAPSRWDVSGNAGATVQLGSVKKILKLLGKKIVSLQK